MQEFSLVNRRASNTDGVQIECGKGILAGFRSMHKIMNRDVLVQG
jgi:hypothetical protein